MSKYNSYLIKTIKSNKACLKISLESEEMYNLNLKLTHVPANLHCFTIDIIKRIISI